MTEVSSQRRCTRCKEVKAAGAFYQNPKGRWESWCRSCTSEYRIEYYEKNRTKIVERRGPYNRDYQRRKRANPEYNRQSIQNVRNWWDGLTDAEKKKLNKRKKLARRYGLSLDEYDAICLKQKGACAICGSSNDNLHIDHCHTTNRVRGLLCLGCNVALGWFEKIAPQIDKVSAYLQGHSECPP